MTKENTQEPRFLTTPETCEYLQIGRSTLADLKGAGLLTPIPRGKETGDLYDLEQLDHFLACLLYTSRCV